MLPNPKVLSKTTISAVADKLIDEAMVYLAGLFLDQLADSRLDDVSTHDDQIIDAMKRFDNLCATASSLLVKMAVDEVRYYLFIYFLIIQHAFFLSKQNQQCTF